MATAAGHAPSRPHGPAQVAGRLPVSVRERQVVESLLTFGRVPLVAEVLGISVHTARNHLKSVLRKLHLHSQGDLFRMLLERDDSTPFQ